MEANQDQEKPRMSRSEFLKAKAFKKFLEEKRAKGAEQERSFQEDKESIEQTFVILPLPLTEKVYLELERAICDGSLKWEELPRELKREFNRIGGQKVMEDFREQVRLGRMSKNEFR